MLCCLWYKVAYKTNTFWNWKQRTTVKAFEDALQYIEMHVLGFYCQGIFLKCAATSHST